MSDTCALCWEPIEEHPKINRGSGGIAECFLPTPEECLALMREKLLKCRGAT